jgi:hypothetical protein
VSEACGHVDEARQDHCVRRVIDLTARGHLVDVDDADDLFAANVNRRRPRPSWRDDAAAADGEVG